VRERFEQIYTAALTDILDDRGLRNQTLPHELRPLVPGSRVAGPAYTIEGRPAEIADWDATLRKVLKMLGEVPAGHVAVYSCHHDVSAHLGELSVTSLQARGVAGAVIDGGCRDTGFIAKTGFPVFSRYVTPEDSTWRWELTATNEPVTIGRVEIAPGDWIVADEDGVIAVPAGIAEEVLAAAEGKAAAETTIRSAVRDGMSPLEAYEKYGTF
jgi:4-hydroxy-4-methyl-2-oxoglutarate aldolase